MNCNRCGKEIRNKRNVIMKAIAYTRFVPMCSHSCFMYSSGIEFGKKKRNNYVKLLKEYVNVPNSNPQIS